MVSSMKVLVGYDGSACSDAAIADLRHAGLPRQVEAVVVSVAEVYPQVPPSAFEAVDPGAAADMSPAVRTAHTLARLAMDEARRTCAQGAARVRSLFPHWDVREEVSGDVPHRGLVMAAEKASPDLLVVGSHGRSGIGRMVLGSVSQNVLSYADCSVRIGRCAAADARPAEAPVKVAVGVDGSVDAAAAVSAVASRAWPTGSEALVIVVIDVPISMALAGVGPPIATFPNEPDLDGHAWAKKRAAAVERELRDAGLKATSSVRDGDPKRVLVAEAQRWGADCIFVGAKGHGRMEKILIGSVSAAVAARAHCSVEVVRQG